MFGKFCASMSYAIIYLFSSELFPTSIRNTGMGCCSMVARIGSMTAPFIIGLVRSYYPLEKYLKIIQ
jgi:MFS transporter, OCT family, solute carrier family 22 (organic cation transporter), member 4/5